jgi:hypothetical protein
VASDGAFRDNGALFDAVRTFAYDRIVEERAAPAGGVHAAVKVIFSHYEDRGDAVRPRKTGYGT